MRVRVVIRTYCIPILKWHMISVATRCGLFRLKRRTRPDPGMTKRHRKRDRMKTSRMTKPGIRDGCLNQEPETGI